MKDYDLLNNNLNVAIMSYQQWRSQPKFHSESLKEGYKLTYRLREKVLERDGRFCKVCGASTNLHIDHIIPLSKGGKTILSNLQVLCKKCNLQKGNKTMEQFIQWRKKNGKTYKTRP